MMSKSLGFKSELLLKIFNNVDISWDDVDKFYISLHTDDPGADGTQMTNETNYSNYSRQLIKRNDKAWLITENRVENKKSVEFPVCISGKSNITHIAIGFAKTGDSEFIYSGKLGTALLIEVNKRPVFDAGTIVILES
jgi:hypothetical protein